MTLELLGSSKSFASGSPRAMSETSKFCVPNRGSFPGKCNEWISLAFVKLGIGGPKPFNDYAFVENHALVPKIEN